MATNLPERQFYLHYHTENTENFKLHFGQIEKILTKFTNFNIISISVQDV